MLIGALIKATSMICQALLWQLQPANPHCTSQLVGFIFIYLFDKVRIHLWLYNHDTDWFVVHPKQTEQQQQVILIISWIVMSLNFGMHLKLADHVYVGQNET